MLFQDVLQNDWMLISNELQFEQTFEGNEGLLRLHSSWILALYWLELKKKSGAGKIARVKKILPAIYHILCATGHPKVGADICWDSFCKCA